RAIMMSGVTSECDEHLRATGLRGCDLRMKMFLNGKGRYLAEPSKRDNFELTTFPPKRRLF
ncbi:MAG: hypothetical protein VX228_08400, partial [Pseudomonadota bacterium]|nr:hypothetical protein [Pseudomonadota bacterium]